MTSSLLSISVCIIENKLVHSNHCAAFCMRLHNTRDFKKVQKTISGLFIHLCSLFNSALLLSETKSALFLFLRVHLATYQTHKETVCKKHFTCTHGISMEFSSLNAAMSLTTLEA